MLKWLNRSIYCLGYRLRWAQGIISEMGVWDIGNIQHEPQLFAKWQQRCGLSLSVLHQLLLCCCCRLTVIVIVPIIGTLLHPARPLLLQQQLLLLLLLLQLPLLQSQSRGRLMLMVQWLVVVGASVTPVHVLAGCFYDLLAHVGTQLAHSVCVSHHSPFTSSCFCL